MITAIYPSGALNRLLLPLAGVVLALMIGVVSALLTPISLFVLLVLMAFGVLALMTPLAAVMVLLILAPMRALIATEASFQLPLDIGQLAFALLLVTWTGRRIAYGHMLVRLHWTPLYIPILLFTVVIGINIFYAQSLAAWVTEALKWIVVLLTVALVLDVSRNNRLWEWIVFGLVLAGLGNALVGIYIFFGGSGADHLIVNQRFFRAFGTFGQPNPFGGFLGLLAPLAIMATYGYGLRAWHQRFADARTILICVFYALAAVIIVLGVLLSWSRGAWLGLVIALTVVLFAAPRRLWQGTMLLAMAAVVIGLLWTSGRLPSTIVDRLGSVTRELFTLSDVRGVDISIENYAVIERLAHWQAAMNMTRAHPFTGVGLGNFEIVYDSYRLLSWEMSLGHAHNYYLNVLAETGIIGLAVHLFVFMNLLWFTWYTTRVHPDELSRAVAVGLLGTWSYLLVHSLTDNLYVNNIFIHFGFMVGILAVVHAGMPAQHKTMGIYGNGRKPSNNPSLGHS